MQWLTNNVALQPLWRTRSTAVW